LAERDCTPTEIATQLDLDELAAGKVVRALTALGVAEAEGEHYRAAAGLREHFLPGDRDIVPFLEHSHAMYERWGANLEPWLRGEGWETAERTPEEVRRFGAAMRAMGSQMAKRAAVAVDLEGVDHILDVGGGWGHFAKALCDAKPDLRATVLDIPEVAERAAADLVDTEFEDRIEYLPGDYLSTDYGSDYDLVLFANVLHQETGERAAVRLTAALSSSISPSTMRSATTSWAPSSLSTCAPLATPGLSPTFAAGWKLLVSMRSSASTSAQTGGLSQAASRHVERLTF